MNKVSHHIAAEFRPTKSGIFTLGSLVIATIMMVSGASFAAKGLLLPGFMLFIPGIGFALASYYLGFKSSKDQDLEDGNPYQVSADNSSYRVVADSRTNPETLLKLIAAAATVIKDRKPLPEASGTIDNSGQTDATKYAEANLVVQAVNEEIENDFKSLEDALTIRQRIDQAVIENAPKFVSPTHQAQESAERR